MEVKGYGVLDTFAEYDEISLEQRRAPLIIHIILRPSEQMHDAGIAMVTNTKRDK